MCFNAPVSLAAFLVGSILALFVGIAALCLHYTSLALLSFGWVWVIAMQWWEYMVWQQWHPETASRLAFIFNVMQIPLLYLLLAIGGSASFACKVVASFVIAVYLCCMFFPIMSSPLQITETSGTPPHLYYSWWKPSWKAGVYLVALCAIFLLLLRPLPWSAACLGVLAAMFVASGVIYGMESIASLWCFFAVFFPVIALALRVLWA